MKEYKYRGFNEPIKVDENGNATYRGYEVEKYFHGYQSKGMASGFSASQLAKAHYIEEMKRIDKQIVEETYRKKSSRRIWKSGNGRRKYTILFRYDWRLNICII